jgi:co-chaperonin GroES (HSP10)
MIQKSPFKPFGNYIILSPVEKKVTAEEKDTKEELSDGRAVNPWGKVLETGPSCRGVNEGDTVMYFYAEEVEKDGVKYLIVKESDLFVSLK